MRSGGNNFRPTLGNWHAAPATNSNHDEPGRLPSMFAASRSFQASPDVSAGAMIPWRPSEERIITAGPPSGLATRFRGQFVSRMQNLGGRDNYNMGREQMRQVSPPGFTGQRTVEENSNSNSRASKKLKKEIYNPIATPKRISRRLSLYYRDGAKSNIMNEIMEKDEDGKRCAVCLEDFEAREEVMLTPCDHMFHEDCIMPWVKSHGQCPVCRYAFAFSPPPPQNLNNNNNNVAYVEANDVITADLMSIMRAMEELAFQWGNNLGAR